MLRGLAHTFATVLMAALAGALPVTGSPVAAGGVGWPGFRGPGLDGAARDAAALAAGDRLELAWRRPLGSGYSGVSVAGGRLVTLYSDGTDDFAVALDAEGGETLWSYRIGPTYRGHDGSHDGPISTPLILDRRVFGLGPHGKLFALDLASGAELWSVDLVAELGGEAPTWGFATSPVAVGGVVVVEIGSPELGAVAGFDPVTGERLWTAGDDEVSYQSPTAMTLAAGELAGRELVVAAGDRWIYGIEPASGRVVWQHEHEGDGWALGSESLVPVPAGDGRLLLTHHTDRAMLIEVAVDAAGETAVREVWKGNAIRGTYAVPVYLDGFLYGVTGRLLTCVDAASGRTAWRSRQPGDGFVTLVGERLAIVTKAGGLHLAGATPEGYRELAALDLFADGSWTPAAFADGRLYARGLGEIARVDLADAEASTAARRPGATPPGSRLGGFLASLPEAPDRAAAIDAFLGAAGDLPIIEPPDLVHFVYRGDAEDVGLVADGIGARREEPMHRVPGTDLFIYSVRALPASRIGYHFIRDFDEPIPDPRNPRTQPGVGQPSEVSWVALPGWRSEEGAGEGEGAPPRRRGRLENRGFKSPTFDGAPRRFDVYLPAGYDDGDRRYPVLYVPGGAGALARGDLRRTLDRLMGESVEPALVVFIYEPPARSWLELVSVERDRYVTMVTRELVPAVDRAFRTVAERRARAIWGAGAGGYAALYAAFSRPELFGRAASQSAEMMTVDELALGRRIDEAGEAPLAIYLAWGSYDPRAPHENWDMVEANRALDRLLRRRGYDPAGGEVSEGPGWGAWSRRAESALKALLPLPPEDERSR